VAVRRGGDDDQVNVGIEHFRGIGDQVRAGPRAEKLLPRLGPPHADWPGCGEAAGDERVQRAQVGAPRAAAANQADGDPGRSRFVRYPIQTVLQS
jgi:hypothetical protein